jgi:hypothetical protein
MLQCGLDSVIVFTPVLWPDFSFWHLLAGVVQYQLQQDTANVRRELRDSMGSPVPSAASPREDLRFTPCPFHFYPLPPIFIFVLFLRLQRMRIEHAAKIAEEERLGDEAAILAEADAVISSNTMVSGARGGPSRFLPQGYAPLSCFSHTSVFQVDLLRERRQKRLQRQASFLKALYSRREAMFARLAAEEEANGVADAGVEVAA